MTESQSDAREQRINEVLAAYLQAVEAGEQPNRDELLRRHPELAGELRSFFADQDAVLPGAVVRPAAGEQATLPPGQPPVELPLRVRYIGDYELLEELGRGG